jgi:hypothetical protein
MEFDVWLDNMLFITTPAERQGGHPQQLQLAGASCSSLSSGVFAGRRLFIILKDFNKSL